MKHLRQGCLTVQRDETGRPYRWLVTSLAFKGENDSAGVTATWVVGEPAARAISILQRLQASGSQWLFAPLHVGPGAGSAGRAGNQTLTSLMDVISLHVQGPHSPRYTLHVAWGWAEACRVLNYATQCPEGLPWPVTAYEMTGALRTGVQRLPQLLQQTSRFLTSELGARRAGDKSGADPAIAVASAALALAGAITAACSLEEALACAQNALTNLYQPATSADTDDNGREDFPEWWEENAPAEQDTNALPPESVAALARLLRELDEFLRGGGPAADDLADFLRQRGDRCPGFAACNLIDEPCFTAAQFRRLAGDVSAGTAAYTHPDDIGEEQQRSPAAGPSGHSHDQHHITAPRVVQRIAPMARRLAQPANNQTLT